MGARGWAGAALVYLAVTAWVGRDVLAHLGTTIANDPGDPLLTAAILLWNASHVPLTSAWWDFPIFHPTRAALTFSEHLLGLSVVSSPLTWIGGNPLATYNLTLLLTFPLCALSAYALVYRLTGSVAGAFIAGLAYGFAPYRVSGLPHIQMLASFWAPLALLGLHAYLQTRRRRWLALYGLAWLLQVTTNAYTLVLLSVLVAAWVCWFLVARREWRALSAVALTTLVAMVPLAPVLYTYVTVHGAHGFARNADEVRTYSADVVALLCAPAQSTWWSWLRVGCRAEGELFPGVGVAALFIAALVRELRDRAPGSTVMATRRVLLVVAVLFACVVLWTQTAGPIDVRLGPVRISASDPDKPLLVAVAAAVLALLLSLLSGKPWRRSPVAFYLFATVAMWLFALGPTVTVLGESSGRPGPFALLQLLPGVDGLRVPARFWLMAVLCLAIAAGLFVAQTVTAVRRRRTAIVAAIAAVLLVDGWMGVIPAQPVPTRLPDEAALEGDVVLELPLGPFLDIASTWRAVNGGWRAVNGYSGYAPHYYQALRLASEKGEDAAFVHFRRNHDLQVVVREEDTPLRHAVERQPGAMMVARADGMTRYLLPMRARPPSPPAGPALDVTSVRTSCASADAGRVVDGDEDTAWLCVAGTAPQQLLADLGQTRTVSAVVYGLGRRYGSAIPAALRIETSEDGANWVEARSTSILDEAIEAGLANPRSLDVTLRFEPRPARYVRLSPVGMDDGAAWFVAELEVRGP